MGTEMAPVVVAHGFSDAGPLPIPMQMVLLVAALVVVAAASISPQHSNPAPALARTVGPTIAMVLRIAVAILLVAIVVPAAFGNADTSDNPAPRLLFTVAWAGLLLASVVLGPVWPKANPLRWAGARDPRGAALYGRLGLWPAAGGLVLLGIAEQVFDPQPLLVLITVAVYVLAMGAGAVLYGHGWFRAADPLDAVSRLLGRLAPIGRRGRRLVARRIRAGVATTGTVPGMAAFLGVLTAANLYDAMEPAGGLGIRLLIFAAVTVVTTVVLAAAARPEYLLPVLIPVAAAHLGAHYLAPLLVDTQIAVIQASDPLGRGWDLFGLTGAEPNATPIPILAAQAVQWLLLVAGHALAMVVTTDIAGRHLTPRAARAAVFPLRAAIIASLVAGVYLRLGT